MEIRMACQIVEWERKLEIEKEKQGVRGSGKYSAQTDEQKNSHGASRAVIARIFKPIADSIAAFRMTKAA